MNFFNVFILAKGGHVAIVECNFIEENPNDKTLIYKIPIDFENPPDDFNTDQVQCIKNVLSMSI